MSSRPRAIFLLLILLAIQRANGHASSPSADREPQYLIFQLGTENRDFEVFLPEIKAEFGAAPAGSPRYVGFGVALMTLKTPIEDLRRQVTHALDLAEESGLPVFLKLDDVNFNLEYTDPSMVEWTAFPKPGETHGPPAKHYWLNWGSWMALPPPPNFESPAFRQEVERRLRDGVLPPLLERLARWQQQKRLYLFAGTCLGWESGIPEYRPLRQVVVLPRDDQRQITMSKEELGEQLGYASLYARGWTQQKIRDAARESGKNEEDVTTELLFQVIHDYSVFWAKTVHEAGIPKERIYTHGVAWESVPEQRLPGAWMRKSSRVPPIWVNVNAYSRPGYTVGAGQFEPGTLAKLLRAAGATDGWGAVEAYVRGVETEAAFGGYLRQLFDMGAQVIDIFGWTARGSPYDPRGTPGAVHAAHLWLAGKALPETARQAAPSGNAGEGMPQKLQQKMERLRSLVEQQQQAGADAQRIGELMMGFPRLVQQQKFSEAEALVDRALVLAGGASPPAPTTLIAYGGLDSNRAQPGTSGAVRDHASEIFAATSEGTLRGQLTQGGNRNSFPAWSADGKRLAFVSDRSGGALQIWVMEADGSNPRPLTTQGENVTPAWSPDGKKFAFGSNRTGHFEIWVMNADGSHPKQLTTTDATVSNNAAAWSPDGRQIAFASTRSGHPAIWVMNADGSHLLELSTPRGDRYPASNVPAWSPDGTKIAFWSGIEQQYGNIWVMNSDGTNPMLLTDQPAGINCDEPVWSPDGRKILYSTNRPGSEGVAIWIMDADGSNQRVLLRNTRSRASWQPMNRASQTQ